MARSAAAVAGPALAGLLVASVGPPAVIALDAASYAVSAAALAALRAAAPGATPARPRSGGPPFAGAGDALSALRIFARDAAEGWVEFRARPWLVATTAQFALFNLLTWGPFLVLGPVVARDRLGGAGAWGAVMACYGAGALLGGFVALRRRPRRPILASEVAAFGFALPCALLAVGAPTAGVAAGALAAGGGGALGAAWETTVMQRQIPARALARVSALQTVIAFSFGPVAFAVAGPVAAEIGAGTVLAFGAAWSVVGTAAVLALPSVRQRWPDPAETASAAHGTSARERPA